MMLLTQTTSHMSHMVTSHEQRQHEWPAISIVSHLFFLFLTFVLRYVGFWLNKWCLPTFPLLIGSQIIIVFNTYFIFCHHGLNFHFIIASHRIVEYKKYHWLSILMLWKLQHGKIERIWYLQSSKTWQVVECAYLDWCNLIRTQITTKYATCEQNHVYHLDMLFPTPVLLGILLLKL
jgi:hypothetical protein